MKQIIPKVALLIGLLVALLCVMRWISNEPPEIVSAEPIHEVLYDPNFDQELIDGLLAKGESGLATFVIWFYTARLLCIEEELLAMVSSFVDIELERLKQTINKKKTKI